MCYLCIRMYAHCTLHMHTETQMHRKWWLLKRSFAECCKITPPVVVHRIEFTLEFQQQPKWKKKKKRTHILRSKALLKAVEAVLWLIFNERPPVNLNLNLSHSLARSLAHTSHLSKMKTIHHSRKAVITCKSPSEFRFGFDVHCGFGMVAWPFFVFSFTRNGNLSDKQNIYKCNYKI